MPSPIDDAKKAALDDLDRSLNPNGGDENRVAPSEASLNIWVQTNAEELNAGMTAADALYFESRAAAFIYNPGFPVPEGGLGLAATADEHPPRDLTSDAGWDGLHDLSVPALKTLGDYVQSQASINKFVISPVVEDPSGLKKGTSLDPMGKGGANPFVDYGSVAGKTNLEQQSGGGASNTRLGGFFKPEQLQEILTKDQVKLTEQEGLPPDGHELLRVKNSPYPNPKITDHTVDNLEETNRYSPKPGSSAYLKGGEGTHPDLGYIATITSELEAIPKGLWSVQTGHGLGKFDKNAPGVTVKELKAMALQVMLAATSHKVLGDDLNLGSGGFSFLADLAALWPGLVQIGVQQVNVQDLRMKNTTVAKNFGKSKTDAFANAAASAAAAMTPPGVTPPEFNIGSAGYLAGSRGSDDLILQQGFSREFGVGEDGEPSIKLGGTNVPLVSSPRSAASYGSLNSFVEWFDGPAPFGMLLIVLYSIIIIALLSLTLDAATLANTDPSKLMAGDNQIVKNALNPSTLAMGSMLGEESGNSVLALLAKIFDFPVLTSGASFPGAVLRGLMAFYGFPEDPMKMAKSASDLGGILDVVLNLALAPGYYATVTKQVLRDAEQIIGNITAFGQASGVTGIITQLFKLVFAITESTTYQFIMTMAIVGDIHYRANHNPGGLLYDQIAAIPLELEDDIRVMTPALRTEISRFYGGPKGAKNVLPKGPLSLTLFDSLLLPGNEIFSYMKANSRTGPQAEEATAKPTDPDLGGASPGLINATAGNRFGRELVQKYELALETEYTPFYIHDLRTNEIIALPAFITSIGDSFQADYGSTHPYGRTDPVMSYSKTTRSIDLTFKMVSMGPADHEYMWGVINRLTMMLYPQRSAGRIRTYNNKTRRFVQPFSQVPTASPVVRLRLGELFHTNYSVNGLARLFGDKTGILDLDSSGADDLAAINKAIDSSRKSNLAAEQKKIRGKMKAEFIDGKLGVGDKFYASAGSAVTLLPSAFGSFAIPKPQKKTVFPTSFRKNTRAHITITKAGEEVQSKEVKGSFKGRALRKKKTFWVYEGKIDLTKSGKDGKGIKPSELISIRKSKAAGNDADATELSVKFAVPLITNFEPENVQVRDEATAAMEKKFPDASAAQTAKPQNEEFFSVAKNAIVRSFATTAGKGLAGVITQMSLNEMGAATWGTEPLRHDRVPKHIEISLSFTPIHDLPLGLDYNGVPIAPVYPTHNNLMDPYAAYSPPGEAREAAVKAVQTQVTENKAPEAKAQETKADEQESADSKAGADSD